MISLILVVPDGIVRDDIKKQGSRRAWQTFGGSVGRPFSRRRRPNRVGLSAREFGGRLCCRSLVCHLLFTRMPQSDAVRSIDHDDVHTHTHTLPVCILDRCEYDQLKNSWSMNNTLLTECKCSKCSLASKC